jgi:Fe-S oxidoreductase
VSNAEPRETLTPWGKMSSAWMGAHGDVARDRAHAAPAWACTDCGACTAACEHRNPVADTLLDARDAYGAGFAPAGAGRAIAGFARHAARTRAAAQRLGAWARREAGGRAGTRESGAIALLVGCTYLRGASAEARDAVRVVEALTGATPAVVDACCGLPLRLAGDRPAFAAHAAAVAKALRGRGRLLVLDPGCAVALGRHYAAAGVEVRPAPELLVESVAAACRAIPRDVAREATPREPHEPVRWHDPCQMGRGLGAYEAPRTVLARVIGRAPDEFVDRREEARCSGGGGLLPATMPDIARSIADTRLEAHVRAGGGRLVTGCGSSLIALRRSAAASGVRVDDLVSWMVRALG